MHIFWGKNGGVITTLDTIISHLVIFWILTYKCGNSINFEPQYHDYQYFHDNRDI